MEEVIEISLARHPSDLVPAALVLLILTIFLTIGVAGWITLKAAPHTISVASVITTGAMVTLTEKSPFALSSH